MTCDDKPFADRQIRAAEGESASRIENERTEELSPGSEFTGYTCECTEACDAVVLLTRAEYEHVRGVPTHFLAAPGHLVVGVEIVVRASARFQVIEKIGAAARMATTLDPRGRPLDRRDAA